MSLFRFAIGQHVRIITHPAKPLGTIVERWTGEELRDGRREHLLRKQLCHEAARIQPRGCPAPYSSRFRKHRLLAGMTVVLRIKSPSI